MKFKRKKTLKENIILLLALIIVCIFSISSSLDLKRLSGNVIYSVSSVDKFTNGEDSPKIKEYKESLETLVEENDLGKKFINIVSQKDGRYVSLIFSSKTGETLSFESLIKSEYKDKFWQKVTELISLKYPKFISSVLEKHDHNNVYIVRKNELVIYFYDYAINPSPEENLFIKVNYNDVKDMLDIPVSYDSTYAPEDGTTIDLNKKLVAITFDDGPGSYTNELLDILEDNKARSTFFMLGKNISYYADVVKRAAKLKMEIGYHSYAHTSFKRQELATVQEEFNLSNETLKNITGDTFHLVRPPYGAINSDIKNALDAPFILWNIDTEDWRHRDSDYLVNYTLEHLNDGNIILFHDIHKTSVEAISKLLPILYVRGYQVVTVSDLAKATNTTLEAHTAYQGFRR